MGQPLVQPQQPQALTSGSPPPPQLQVQIQQAPQHSPALCYFFFEKSLQNGSSLWIFFHFHFVQKILWWTRNLFKQKKCKKNCVSKMTECFQKKWRFLKSWKLISVMMCYAEIPIKSHFNFKRHDKIYTWHT